MNSALAAVLVAMTLSVVAGSVPAGARGSPTKDTSATPSATKATLLSDVLDKYANALGGRTILASIHSQETVGTITVLGRVFVERETTKAPCYYRLEVQPQGTSRKTVVGFDGNTAWRQGPDGVTSILTGAERAKIISDAAVDNRSELFPTRWPTQVVLRPRETYDQKSYIVLNITAKGGVTWDLLLDSQTYRQTIWRRVLSKTDAAIVKVNSFSKGPSGEWEPKSYTTWRADTGGELTVTVNVVHDNVDVSNTLFAPPI